MTDDPQVATTHAPDQPTQILTCRSAARLAQGSIAAAAVRLAYVVRLPST
jgi:hypothetical protein